jgi:hypothetical protein
MESGRSSRSVRARWLPFQTAEAAGRTSRALSFTPGNPHSHDLQRDWARPIGLARSWSQEPHGAAAEREVLCLRGLIAAAGATLRRHGHETEATRITRPSLALDVHGFHIVAARLAYMTQRWAAAGRGFEPEASGSIRASPVTAHQARNKLIHAQRCGISRSDTADCNPLALPGAVPIWTVDGHRIKTEGRARWARATDPASQLQRTHMPVVSMGQRNTS